MNSSNTAPALVLWSVFDFSFSTGMWAVSGLALSAVFPDIFVAFCAPVIMNYLWNSCRLRSISSLIVGAVSYSYRYIG